MTGAGMKDDEEITHILEEAGRDFGNALFRSAMHNPDGLGAMLLVKVGIDPSTIWEWSAGDDA